MARSSGSRSTACSRSGTEDAGSPGERAVQLGRLAQPREPRLLVGSVVGPLRQQRRQRPPVGGSAIDLRQPHTQGLGVGIGRERRFEASARFFRAPRGLQRIGETQEHRRRIGVRCRLEQPLEILGGDVVLAARRGQPGQRVERVGSLDVRGRPLVIEERAVLVVQIVERDLRRANPQVRRQRLAPRVRALDRLRLIGQQLDQLGVASRRAEHVGERHHRGRVVRQIDQRLAQDLDRLVGHPFFAIELASFCPQHPPCPPDRSPP